MTLALRSRSPPGTGKGLRPPGILRGTNARAIAVPDPSSKRRGKALRRYASGARPTFAGLDLRSMPGCAQVRTSCGTASASSRSSTTRPPPRPLSDVRLGDGASVLIDPPGCAPIFASLTRGATAAQRRTMAIRSSVIAWVILMFFALLGKPMLEALGISLGSFRIAGGVMLFMIALDMVFERRTKRREERAQSIDGTPEAEDISVFPMAIRDQRARLDRQRYVWGVGHDAASGDRAGGDHRGHVITWSACLQGALMEIGERIEG